MADILFPFLSGDAVYHVGYPGRVDDLPSYQPGVVLKITPKARFSVRLTATGQRVTAWGAWLCYAGHCPRCERPAVVRAGRLVCPECGGPAAEVPPVDLAAQWMPPCHLFNTLVLYELAHGATTMQQVRQTYWRSPWR